MLTVRLNPRYGSALLVAVALGSAACATASNSSASSARTASASPQVSGPTGSIEGAISYPAEVAPPVAVYAVATDGSRFVYVEKTTYGMPVTEAEASGSTYRLLGIEPGDYFVLAAIRDPKLLPVTSGSRSEAFRRFNGGYTKIVQCGLAVGCNDHTLVAVHVAPGVTVTGID